MFLAAIVAWVLWPGYLLHSAATALDGLYIQYRPFPYRWNGAHFGPAKAYQNGNCAPVPEETLASARLAIADAVQRSGETARSLRLRGRVGLLDCQPKESIREYRLAIMSRPDDPELQLELGIAFALNVDPKNPLPYEDALEHILKAGQKSKSAEFLYDSALLFEQTQLFLQARERWAETADADALSEWKDDSKRHSDAIKDFLSARGLEINTLSWPESYFNAPKAQRKSGEELALEMATGKWLVRQPPEAAKALQLLGDLLRRDHGDKWLVDLLKTESLPQVRSAQIWLAQAIRLNLKGEHSSAAAAAFAAEKLFANFHNSAGVLRARLEIVYSLDRLEKADACLAAANAVESEAHQKKYIWVEAQARLERVTCMTRERRQDVIAAKKEARDWIKDTTHYSGLGLRSLSFMTEPYVATDSRLNLWLQAQQGLKTFWVEEPLPIIRVYSFYYTLANSARNAGHLHAARAILHEGTLLMQGSGLCLLRGILLSSLGQWEMEAGLQEKANRTFVEMEKAFDQVKAKEIAKVRSEGRVAHAEALIATGHAPEARELLQLMTQGIPLSSSDANNKNLRRVLFPALGQAYLANDNFEHACENFLPSIKETQDNMTAIQSHAQRDSAMREIEPSWRGMTAVKLRQHRPVEALNLWETFRSGRNPQIPSLPVPNCDSATDRSGFPLPENRTALVYAFLPTTGLSAWMIKGGNVEQKQLNGIGIKERAERLSALVSDPDSPVDDISTLSADLYQALLKPFAADLPPSGTLIIDADGELAGIPWSVLEEKPHHPLVERFAIAQVIGILDLNAGGEETEAGRERALIFEPPNLSEDLTKKYPYPSDAREETEAVKGLLPKPLLIPQDEANLQTLQAEASRTSLFHFSGHSINNGGFSALLLPWSRGSPPEEQYVTAEQVAQLALRQMKTVVLASCSSGVGEQFGTVNLDSLTRAFLEAGTHRVIAAGWDVSSARTKELMIAFYQQLKQGKSPAEALRLAELEMREKAPHPYYWAGFEVFGEP